MSMILQTPRLTPSPSTNLSSLSISSSSAHSLELNLLSRISRLSFQTPNFPATTTTTIQMRGGPRKYPGGLNKYQWRRVKSVKTKKLHEAGVRREPRIYQMRKRAELRSAVSELERPWESFDGGDEQFKIYDDYQSRKQGKSYSKRSVLGEKPYGSITGSGNSSLGGDGGELESRPSCSFGERGNGSESDSEIEDEFGNLSFDSEDEFDDHQPRKQGDDELSMANCFSKRSVLGVKPYWSITGSGNSSVEKDCRELERPGCSFGERSNGPESDREIEDEFGSSVRSDDRVSESSYWNTSRIFCGEERIGDEKGGSPSGRLGNEGKMDSGKFVSNKEGKCEITSARRSRYGANTRGHSRGRVSRKMKLSHSGEVLNFEWDGTYDKSRANH